MEESSAEQERWQKRADAFRARMDKLREKFPGGGWVRFLIHANPEAPSLKKDKLFAYSVSYEVRICQDYTMTCGLGEADLTQYGLPFEVSETTGVMEVWVESPGTSGVIVGLIAAEDRAAALAKLRAHPRTSSDEQEAGNCAPAPNVVMPVPDCHCESEAVTE